MKRSEIETRMKLLVTDFRAAIVRAPLQWFSIGVLLGIMIAALSAFFVPLIFIFLIVAAVFWFLADEDADIVE